VMLILKFLPAGNSPDWMTIMSPYVSGRSLPVFPL
jgi:hypothetical protein